MEANENYTYETKCRRCGRLNDWFYQTKKHASIEEFVRFKVYKLEMTVTENHCDICKKLTVHDIVSFSD